MIADGTVLVRAEAAIWRHKTTDTKININAIVGVIDLSPAI
jgi:hypothetical protein